jgi:tRNA uridine 5-carbamoylmethylation protein Kti12
MKMAYMEYCIIIRGPLGVGKTTVSRKLARVLHAKYVSVDSVLEKNGLDKVESGSIPVRNFIRANNIICKKYRSGKIVIDGNFYYRKQLSHLAKNMKMPCHVFTLKAPLKVCIERDEKRKIKYGKSAVKDVYSLVAKFGYGAVLNTKDKTPDEIIKEVISYLPGK